MSTSKRPSMQPIEAPITVQNPASPAAASSGPVELLDLLRDGRHFSEVRGGDVHIIDSITGLTVFKTAQDIATAASSRLVRVETPNGVVTYAQDTDASLAVSAAPTYNPLILDLICQKVAEGGNVTDICREPGMPTYNMLSRWRRAHPEVDRALAEARKDRAEYLRDQAMKKVEDTYEERRGTRDQVAAAALAVDATKWATGVDHERYNPKTKVEANVTVPTQIIVQTGIVRE